MNLFDFSNIKPGYAAESQKAQFNPFGAAMDITGGVKMAPAPYAPGTTQEQADIIQQSYKTPSVETPTTSIDTNALKNMSDDEIDMLMQSFITDSSQNANVEQPKKETIGEMATGSIADATRKLYGQIAGAVEKTGEAFVTGSKQIGQSAYQLKSALEEGRLLDTGRPLVEGLVRGVGGVVFSPVAGVGGQAIGENIVPAVSILTPQVAKDLAASGYKNANDWYDRQSEPVKQLIKDLGLTAEGALSIVGVKASPKLAEAALKGAAKVTQAEIKGAEALVKGATQGAKATGESIAKVTKSTGKIITPGKSVDDLVLEISQGSKEAVPKFKKAIQSIDTTGVKNYEQLTSKFDDKIKSLVSKQDELLDTNPKYDVQQLVTTKGKAQANFVQKAIDDMEELYTKSGDLEGLDNLRRFKDANGNYAKLSEKDINDIAREYNSNFGKKAFDKKGDPLSSVSAIQFENTRKGVKEISRSLMKDDAVKIIDDELSSLYSAKNLSGKMVDKVNDLYKRVQERGLLEKIGRGIASAADIATGGLVKGFVAKLLPSNVGLKTLNSLDLEAKLAKNIEKLEKALKEGATDAEIIQVVKDISSEPLKKSPIISNGKLQSTPKQEASSKPLANAKTPEKVPVGNASVPLKNETSRTKAFPQMMRDKGGFIKLPGKAEINNVDTSFGKYKSGRLEHKNGSLDYEISGNSMDIDLVKVYDKQKGTGTLLMKEAEKLAREKGLKEIRLSSQPMDSSIGQNALNSFYEKNGYKNIGNNIFVKSLIKAQ